MTRTKKSSISWSWSANVNVILQLSICICIEKPSRENMKSQTQSQPMTDDRPTFHETLSLSPWRGPTFKRRLKSCFSKHPCSSLLGLFAVFYAHCHPSADSLKHFSFASRSLTLYLTVFLRVLSLRSNNFVDLTVMFAIYLFTALTRLIRYTNIHENSFVKTSQAAH